MLSRRLGHRDVGIEGLGIAPDRREGVASSWEISARSCRRCRCWPDLPGPGEAIGHPVEAAGQASDLVAGAIVDSGREIPLGHALGQRLQALDPAGEHPEEDRARPARDEDRHREEEEDMGSGPRREER
jgi:hypothetical protein